MDWQNLEFAYSRPADWGGPVVLHDVVVVGAGPVGLSLAIDLAQRLQSSGKQVLLLDNDHRLSSGSRAICFAKRTLEIFDRLGVGQPVVDAGVSWNVGRVFFGDEPVYAFDLLPEPGHQRPAFINLQQYQVEGELVQRALAQPNLEIRWQHQVAGLKNGTEQVDLRLETPDGPYRLQARYLAACDGSRSSLRALMGLESTGRVFQDRFLIADVHIEGELFEAGKSERWFWFDPPFHPGQSVLLHRQPAGVWRIDFQLGWQADPDAEKQPAAIVPRVQAMLRQGFGRDVPFTLVWASVYTFACSRMARFRHGRVLFAGDAAHGVSPFGARGANSGVQDADNLGWKLAAALQGRADVDTDVLLDSYGQEREHAADENLLNSSRATDFITPKSEISRAFRDAVLHLAKTQPFAQRLVNSGRLSVPAVLDGSVLSTPDVADAAQSAAQSQADAPSVTAAVSPVFSPALRPGAPAVDAPLTRLRETATGQACAPPQPTWLLQELRRLSADFSLLVFGAAPMWPCPVPVLALDGLALVDAGQGGAGLAAKRYDATPGTAYLLRPDGHVAARWRRPTQQAVQAALQRALGGARLAPAQHV